MARIEGTDMNMHASWHERWQSGRTGWDQGAAHPALLDLIAAAAEQGFPLRGARILEPACGRAHNGATLATLGAHVTSFDVVPEAIRAAREIYGHLPRLTLVEQDAFVIHQDWCESFDAVFDRAALCALGRDLRPVYVDRAWRYLKPNGLLLTIPFTAVHGDPEQGPPFPVPVAELVALTAGRFDLVSARELPPLSPELGRVAREMIMIWRRV